MTATCKVNPEILELIEPKRKKTLIDKKKQGKDNRRHGKEFERKVRHDLEANGWIVSRWNNNINLNLKQFTQAVSIPGIVMQSGYPDFIAIQECPHTKSEVPSKDHDWHIMFVEAKINGYLDRIEKDKAEFYKSKGFKFIIAKKGLNGIEYNEV